MTEDQLTAFLVFARESVTSLARHLIEHGDELIDLSAQRASSLGVEQYGDTSFHLPIERLELEVNEELADAIFYQHIILLTRMQNKSASDAG